MDPVSDALAFGARFLGAQAGQKRSDPFVQSGIVTDRTSSYSQMAKGRIGYGASRASRSRIPVVSRSRINATRKRKTSTKKRKRKTPRGSFKKPKRLKRVSVKYHKHRYEQQSKIDKTADYVYIKVNDQFHRDAVWQAMSDAVIRPLLAKYCKFYPLQDDDKLETGTNSNCYALAFDFKRVRTNGQEVYLPFNASDATVVSQSVIITDRTYEQMRTAFASLIAGLADGAGGVAPDTDTVGYFPYKVSILSTSAQTVVEANKSIQAYTEHLGETMIDLKFVQKTSFLNKTKNDAGTTDMQTSGQNPVKGKLYQFSHMEPRLKDHFTTGVRTQFQDDEAIGVVAVTPTEAELKHPLDAKYWLKNCTKESSIYLNPGATKTHSTSSSIKGKLSTLIERIYYSRFDKGSFGHSSMFMFDLVHHSDNTAGNQTHLEFEFNRVCQVFSAGKLRQPKIYIPDFDATDVSI
jgi:hypothetical protein